MGGKPKSKKKRLYARPVFPKNWPRSAFGNPMFADLWPKDEYGEFKSVAVTDTGWSAAGGGALLGPRQIEDKKAEFVEDFGTIVLELDFEFTEIED